MRSTVHVRTRAGHGLGAVALLLGALAVPAAAQEIAWESGPAPLALGKNVASIWVPEGYVYVGAKETKKLMEMMGNPPSDHEVGLVAPVDESKDWFVVFEHFPIGYVKDDDQDEIDADAILKAIRRGTEEANKYRQKQGVSPLHVEGWFEEPHYDQQSSNLVWALVARDEGRPEERIVNYNVRLLGRRGYMSVTLVTDRDVLAVDKPEVETLLSGFSYCDGSRYADFLPGDKMAQIGLTALVAGGAGVAAAKFGLFAVLGKFLAKAWKLLVIGVAAVAGAIKRFFGRLFGSRTTTLDTL